MKEGATVRRSHKTPFRQRWEEVRTARPLLSSLPFLCVSVLALAGIVFASSCTLCYTVDAGSGPMVYFDKEETYSEAVTRAEAMASDILQTNYTFDQDVTVHRTWAFKDNVESVPGVTTCLLDMIPELDHVYTVRVDGVTVGSAEEQDTLRALLDEAAAAYATEDTLSYEIESAVRYERRYLPAGSFVDDTAQMMATLSEVALREAPYTVQKGDDIETISALFEMTEDRLCELNPDVDFSVMPEIGQVITVEQMCPLLRVLTTEKAEFTRRVLPERETVENDAMYAGQEEIVQEGIPGEESVVAEVVQRYGVRVDSTDLEVTTITEAVPLIVAVGTIEVPELPAGCLFIWPISGHVSSDFGYRYIFGENNFHRGVDIAAPHGQLIGAADAGTVLFVGQRGTYGNLVVVSHSNGFVTYYAHCSSFLVSIGDTVQRGQAVARVGSTGRTTGPHCHFEVRYDNVPIDPLLYLPGANGGPVRTSTPAYLLEGQVEIIPPEITNEEELSTEEIIVPSIGEAAHTDLANNENSAIGSAWSAESSGSGTDWAAGDWTPTPTENAWTAPSAPADPHAWYDPSEAPHYADIGEPAHTESPAVPESTDTAAPEWLSPR